MEWALGAVLTLAVVGQPAAPAEPEDSPHSPTSSKAPQAEPLTAPRLILGDASTTRTFPPATLSSYSQRTWESGTYDGPGKRSKLGHGPNDSGRRASKNSGNARSSRRRGGR